MRRPAPLLLVLLLVLLLGFLPTLSGCGSPTQIFPVATLGQPFELAVGQSVVERGSGYRIALLSVLEDSRCPTDALVDCVWEGRVRLRLGVDAVMGDQGFHEIHLGDQPSRVQLGLLELELLAVTPAARLETIPSRDYRARFVLRSVADLSLADSAEAAR